MQQNIGQQDKIQTEETDGEEVRDSVANADPSVNVVTVIARIIIYFLLITI